MKFEVWIDAALPPDYAKFLAKDGNEQEVGSVVLYGSADLVERNETYEVKKYCSGYVTIGDDGGGRAIMLSLTDGSVSIVGHGVMSPDFMEPVGESFANWLAAGAPIPED